MRLTIKTEVVTFIDMRRRESGTIDVFVVDKAGNSVIAGNLLSFSTDGTVYLYEGVRKDCGFQLNDRGQLITN